MVKVEFTGGTSDLYYLQLTYWIAVFHLGHDNTYHRFSGNRACTFPPASFPILLHSHHCLQYEYCTFLSSCNAIGKTRPLATVHYHL